GALFKPGADTLFQGADFFDTVHHRHPSGVLGPKRTGFRLRSARYDAALLLSNAFSVALIARVAGIRQRVGYRRDARGPLITDGITPPRRLDGSWAPTPAVEYYWTLANHLLRGDEPNRPDHARMELPVQDTDRQEAERALRHVGHLAESDPLDASPPFAVLIPGGSKESKRWPTERFAELARRLIDHHDLRVLVSGAPDEQDVCQRVADQTDRPDRVASLPGSGLTLRGLKPLLAAAKLLVTNDTGPRHIAVALGTPVVTLFGPTDHRWTTVPTRPGAPEIQLLADPSLGPDELANDDPERSRIDRITTQRALDACDEILGRPA
ncbi:MAG: glycosyltransferase family 9 protein, partial [Planctomycetota bacterium]